VAETVPPPDQLALEDRAMAYMMGAMLAIDGSHDVPRALAWFAAAVALVREVGEAQSPVLRMVEPLYTMFQAYETGTLDPSRALAMPVDDPEPWIAGVSRVIRAHVSLNFGRAHAEAELDFHRALAVFRSLGERWGTAASLTSLAQLAGWRGDFGTAIAHGEEALRCVVELGSTEDEAEFRINQSQLLWAGGQPARAHAELALAGRAVARLGVPQVRSHLANIAADIARLEGDLVRAAQLMDEARELMPERAVPPQQRAILASSLGFLASARGDPDEARRQHRRAVEFALGSYDAPVVAQAVVGLAEVALDAGDAGLAATILGAGCGVRGVPDLSSVDGARVARRTEATLGPAAYEVAYERGRSATLAQLGELVDVPVPQIQALTGRG
jgi:tetratricopeptide (TPR) repeat protein